MNKYKLTDIINALVDCFGYSESDFEDMDRKTLIAYISEEQKEIVLSYLGGKK